ncbi:hypothetical protein ACIRRA_42500 [Nocardia sp. NPDC101769]|uniref:hypothetical protein n=1 Tax=Nocardia sp. NPDC101769 TaxID=3364333 RepID=UPI0038203633
MVTGTATLKQHLYSGRWQTMSAIVVMLLVVGFMLALSRWDPDKSEDAPVVPLPAITSPLLPSPSSEPTSLTPRD